MDMDTGGTVETHHNLNGDVNPGRNNAVILHTRNQRAASEKHALKLTGRGIHSTPTPCDDLTWFQKADVSSFDELHLIIDTSMFANIMKNGSLDKGAKKLFKKIERSRKKIYLVDNFPEDFDDLFHELPKNARWRWQDSQDFGAVSTGMTGGEASESLVMGTNNGNVLFGNFTVLQTGQDMKILTGVKQGQAIEQNVNFLKMAIKHDQDEDENNMMLTEVEEHKDKLLNGDVTNAKVEKGSVIITLTVEKSRIMTDDWINDQLKIIFNEILASCVAEGTTFYVNVERFVSFSKEELLKLYLGQHHQNKSKDVTVDGHTEKEEILTGERLSGTDDISEKQTTTDVSTQTESICDLMGKEPSADMATDNMDSCKGELFSDIPIFVEQKEEFSPKNFSSSESAIYPIPSMFSSGCRSVGLFSPEVISHIDIGQHHQNKSKKMRVDGVNSMTSEMSDFESGDFFGRTMMSDVRLHEEKKRWRTRVISLCKDQDRPLNVAIIGPPGVGKSSLVNTIGACFSDETWREYALSGYHGDARQIAVFIKSFSKCCHGRDEEYANVKIPTLIDIAGFSDETGEISVELLRIVFYGRLPEEESLAEAAEYAKKYGLDGLRKKYAAIDEKLKVDRIIIVSSATSLVPKKLIQCVLDAARPSGQDEKRKRTIPLFGVLTKQDKIGSAQISDEEYQEREKQFINAVGLVGSEHRLLRCRNYCDDVDHGRRVETVIPEIDLPVLKFMSQVADPVFEVANEGERYVESEEAQGKEPDTELRRRQPSTTSSADSTTEPRQRVSARRVDPKLNQESTRTKLDVSFYGRLVVGALLVFLVLQFVSVPPVDIVKLQSYCKYVHKSQLFSLALHSNATT